MTLHDCTKAELLEILAVISKDAGTSWDIRLALSNIEMRRTERTSAEAEKLCNLADTKRREYYALLAPYEGKPIMSIPESVRQKALRVWAESEQAENKWMKLMGIEVKNEALQKRRPLPLLRAGDRGEKPGVA